MAKSAPSFRFYPDNFIMGTACMTAAAVGGYIRLLCYQWDKGPIQKIKAKALAGVDSDEIFEEILQKFSEKNGHIFNKRLEVERHKQNEFVKKQRENGRLGGRPGIPKPNPTVKPNQSQKKPSVSVSVSDSVIVSSSDSSPKKKLFTGSKTQPVAVSKSGDTWEAYRMAYKARYGADPIRNQTVNSILCRFVDRVGGELAPFVAEFYVNHGDAFYVKKMHPVNLLLADAEKLATECQTGRKMTTLEARSQEQVDTVTEQLKRLRNL